MYNFVTFRQFFLLCNFIITEKMIMKLGLVKVFNEKGIVKSAQSINIPEIKGSTIEKLYKPQYKLTGMNKDGYHLTSIIEKETGKPVEAYVKSISNEFGVEKWGIYIKDAANEYKQVGERSFKIDREAGVIKPGWMQSNTENGKYLGIGLREHQIAVERMMQENLDTVEIYSMSTAFPFHYKSGFRVRPLLLRADGASLRKMYNTWSKKTGIDKDTLRQTVKFKEENGKRYLDARTFEDYTKLAYAKTKQVPADLPMSLQGEWLVKWKQMAKSQPILLDVKV